MILGIWDGHDSGAALVEGGKIIRAVNEERFTRRKLEVRFPENSIRWLLKFAEPDEVAVPTYDFQKTLSRLFPAMKESYYKFRRRKSGKRLEFLKRAYKYFSTTMKGGIIHRKISSRLLMKRLRKLGLAKKMTLIDHHEAHAWSALQSGFKKCLVITLDGVGDGKSGTISVWNGSEMEKLSEIPAADSLGVFFEQVTTILGFRELEDEGKVSALASYACPEPWEKNPFRDFFSVSGLSVKAKYSPIRQFMKISDISWSMPREQAAFFAQQALEHWTTALISNAIEETGIKDICMAGGVFANIKLNMRIRESGTGKWFVFPHMGDGGLAAGAALAAESSQERIEHVYLGPEYDISPEVFSGLEYEEVEKPEKIAADLVLDGNIVFWYQGRMEYGPRALGHRSILARPDVASIRDELNIRIKRRQWYQPFCPSVLEEDRKLVFDDADQADRFMTMGYRVRPDMKRKMAAVIAADGTSRPQMVGREDRQYRSLIRRVKSEIGIGAVLNTSFNAHGEPIVMTPEDAVSTFRRAGSGVLVIGNYVVRQ